MPLPPMLPVVRAISAFGQNLSLARRRRRFTQASMAERIGASLSTVRRMEKGDGRVPLVHYVSALHVLGALDDFRKLLDTASDEIGLVLMNEEVPRRIRQRKVPRGY